MKDTTANNLVNNSKNSSDALSSTGNGTGWSRRKFVKHSAAAVAAFSLVPRHVLGGPKFVAPSEKINVAIVGCGGQGRTNVRALFNQPDVQIIAVADPIESPGPACLLLQGQRRSPAGQGRRSKSITPRRRPTSRWPTTRISA